MLKCNFSSLFSKIVLKYQSFQRRYSHKAHSGIDNLRSERHNNYADYKGKCFCFPKERFIIWKAISNPVIL